MENPEQARVRPSIYWPANLTTTAGPNSSATRHRGAFFSSRTSPSHRETRRTIHEDEEPVLDKDGRLIGNRSPTPPRSAVTLSGLLNVLDSVSSEEGRLTFATGGNMDVKIQHKFADSDQIEQAFKRFYPLGEHSNTVGSEVGDGEKQADCRVASSAYSTYSTAEASAYAANDPRRGGLFPVNDAQLQECRRIQVSEQLIDPGHYIIAAVTRRHGQETIGHRNASRTGTDTASEGSRKDSVRTKVRSRDLKCRATGQPAPAGSRGYNFTGLEVAHIFPLAEASVFTTAFPTATNEQHLYTPLKIPTFNPRKTHIDIFAYEISLTQQMRYTVPQIRCFEKDGAPSINKNQLNQICPRTDAQYPDVDAMLLTHHFLTALLWHVSGNGLEAHDDAIIPTAFPSVLEGHRHAVGHFDLGVGQNAGL
ncbi:hypothetical protein B0H14DRAFT_2616655 [Mycena olivaceomarginata]|nr:hypothetical protein B0H14DRAFT_2616655 [Mycena olivaceomarginata]